MQKNLPFSYIELFKDNLIHNIKSLKSLAKQQLFHIYAIAEIENIIQEVHIVRLGIGVYGLWPSEHMKDLYKNKIILKPNARFQNKDDKL